MTTVEPVDWLRAGVDGAVLAAAALRPIARSSDVHFTYGDGTLRSLSIISAVRTPVDVTA